MGAGLAGLESYSISREEELYWLALTLVPGLGTRTAGKLLDRFRTPQAVFRASRTELEAAGVSGAVAQAIASGCTFEDAVAQQREDGRSAAPSLITIGDPRYPRCCARSSIRPSCSSPAAAWSCCSLSTSRVVGTRRPTPYGLAVAERLSADLVARRPHHRQRHGARHRYARRTRARWPPAAIPSRCSAAAWISCTRRRTASWPPRWRPRG